jgi:subtilase family serine protease
MATALAACQTTSAPSGNATTSPGAPNATETASVDNGGGAYTPQQIRAAYDITPLYEQGNQGQGQTIIFIESYGSPTLRPDLAVFDKQYGLPDPNLQIIAPLGTVAYNSKQPDMATWQVETALDVEGAHAVAPKANLVVLTSPVDETEGIQGLPQFLQLYQYAVAHHLGTIFTNSWVASDASLQDAAGQEEIAAWEAFLQQAVPQDHLTIFGGSGDWGGTQCLTYDQNAGKCTKWPDALTSGFPADSPYVTGVGGTSLSMAGNSYHETVWNRYDASGGGLSALFKRPNFQSGLPASVQIQLAGQRGVPDVSAAADPAHNLAIYSGGQWQITGGTSAASPFWAGVAAIANQVAGRPLGWLNPALYKIGESAQYSSAFRDITSGNNDFHVDGQSFGYQAAPGWDLTTGWGSPDVAKLIPLLIQNTPA